MPKLAIDLLVFERGKTYGFEEYILNLLSDFKRFRSSLKISDIILVIRDTQETFFREYFSNTYNLKVLSCNSLKDRLLLSKMIPELLGLQKTDIILYPANSMPLSGKKTKALLVIHDLLYRHGDFFKNDLHSLLFRVHRYLYVPRSLRQADKVIAISNFTKDEIIQSYGTSSSKISVIYNYFNFDKYDNDEKTIEDIDGKYILTICSGAKHKNHITLLEGFSRFYSSHKDYKMVFVGGLPPHAQRYLNSLDDSVRNNVVLLKHLSNSDMKYVYENASMYVSASLYEGLGMPVVEALRFGLPTILSNIQIHHEVSLNNATFFDALSPDSLCKSLEQNRDRERKIDLSFNNLLEDMYNTEHTSMRYIMEINLLTQQHLSV